jgi:hypothetical protein
LLKGAKLLVGKSFVVDCVLRNITSVGAKIEMPNTLGLPETLDLTIGGSHSFRRCRCVWRKLNGMGIEFI